MYFKSITRKFAARVAISLAASLPMTAQAADLTWTGNGGVFFNDSGNWNPGQSPTSSDNLTFPSAANKFSLVISGSQNGNGLLFEGGDYSIEGGSGSLLTTTDAYVTDGTSLNIGGADSDWNNTNDIFVGELSTGTLNIENNSNVNHRGLIIGESPLGNGTVNLSGGATLGSSNVGSIGRIGLNGTGVMNVSSGARSDMSSAVLGFFPGATGTLNISGSGTDFVTNGYDVQVGESGSGFLNVSGGGRIRTVGSAGGNGNLTAGHGVDGVGIITLDGGIADSDNRIYVGRGGTGTFNATNGSVVTSDLQFVLGENDGASGTATFDNSTLNITDSIHDLIVGRLGQGQITFDNGSIATIADDILIGSNVASTGDNRLVITGGSSVSTGTATSNAIIVGDAGNGTLRLNGGSSLTSRGLTTAVTADATGTVMIDGAGTSLNLGVLAVSNSGTSTIDVTGGAQVNLITSENIVSNLFIGDDTTANGTLNISGSDGMGTASALIANKQAEIGGSLNEVGGTGTVNVTDGGRFSTAGAKLGVKDNSDAGAGGVGAVNISGSGSIWHSSAEVIVGDNGEGHLNITGGGQADFTANVRVGNQNTADDGPASVSVSGSGSTLTVQGELSVGDDRAATMTISDGAVVTSGAGGSGEGIIGDFAAADGAVVTVDNATWNHNGSRIKVGAAGGSADLPSTLRVINGGQVTATGPIMVSDDAAGSHGLIEVDGAGSSVTTNGDFSIIGDIGTGTLNVTNGGTYNVSGNGNNDFEISGFGTGNVSVTGLGSTINVEGEMSVGRSNNSTGTLTIGNGGTVTTGNVRIARDAGSTGTANLNVGGTLQVNSDSMLTVGGNAGVLGGNGTLNVQGGTVDVASNQVAITARGTVNLTAGTLKLTSLTRSAGSHFNFTGGTLSMSGNQVLDGASLEDIFNDDATLSTGMSLEVTEAASLDSPLRLDGGRFSVGSIDDLSRLDWDRGTVELTAMDVNIQANGLFGDQLILANNQNLTVHQSTTNNGLINATGSTLDFSGGMTNNADLVLVNSTVRGNVNNPAGSTVTVVGQADFSDMVTGAGNFYGPGTANFNGGFSPGDSPAIVTFEGDFRTTNSLLIEIGGNDNSATAEFDQLLIDGEAFVSGTLDVSLIDLGNGTYAPQLGDSFALLSATDGLSGDFGDLNLPLLTGGLEWNLDYTSTSLSLNVINASTVTGDFDSDGDFDGADIDALVAIIASGGSDALFDMNGDGSIDQSDLTQWLAVAGAENLASGGSYLYGDANLDGGVDVSDFNIWNSNKFTLVAAWTRGDFTANGSIDVSDFNNWNSNKFQIADAAAVPEPSGMVLSLMACLATLFLRRR